MNVVNFPEHWKLVRFGEVVTFTKKPRDLRYSEYNEVPFVPMNLIPVAKLFSEEFTLKTNDELSSGTYFEPGDILLSKITPSFENGKQCIIEELPTPFGIATTEVIPIREVVGVGDKFYLFYYLLLPDVRTLLAGRMQGTTGRQRLGKETLVNLEIPLPPLPEQRAIAHILQTIQEAKSTRQREIALERERKAALMDYLFSHGTKGEPRKQTEIGEIPESWEVVELGNYSELITKGSSPKWQGFDYCAEGIFFVRSQNVGLGRLELSEVAYLPKEFNQKEKRSVLQKNDLLINIVGASIGRAAVANDIVEGGNVNQAVAIARLKQGVEPFFVMTFLLTLGGQFQLHKQKKDIARANLSLQDIKNLLIPLPSFSEQAEIAEILQACDTKIATLEQEATRLDELFHAMLHELMTGKRSAVPLID